MKDRSAGYVKLYRQITEWEHYKEPLIKDVFLHILLTSNYANRSRGVKGTLTANMSEIANSTGYSYNQVRTALKRLCETGEIKVERSYRAVKISVLKWNSFQSKPEFERDDPNKDKNLPAKTEFIDRGF